jgi:hypothetical protein
MSDDELVRRLQARANAMRSEPIELTLGSQPGPYRVPLCTRVGLMNTEDIQGLRLETDKGQVVLLPMTGEALESLRNLCERFLRPNEPTN